VDAADKRLLAKRAVALVGVDAGKFHHALVVRHADSRDSKPLIFPTNRAGFEEAAAFISAISRGASPCEVLVGIEFAGSYGATFAHYLDGLGFTVVSVLGAATKAWSRAVHGTPLKTDAKDAATIVDLVSHGRFTGYPFLKPVFAELRYLSSGVRRLVTLRASAINRLRAVLQHVWPEFEHHFRDFAHAVTPMQLLLEYPGPNAFASAPRRKVLARLAALSRGQHDETFYNEVLASADRTVAIQGTEQAHRTQLVQLVELVRFYDRQIEELFETIGQVAAPLPEAEALVTIPRINVRSAGMFLGAIGDPQSYEAGEQVLRLAGLNLITKESGVQKGANRISKRGRSEIRRQMYLIALGMIQKRGVFRDEYVAMVARNGGKKKKALVAISRRALRLMFSIARDRRPFTPEGPGEGIPSPYRTPEEPPTTRA
jgi:transposase